MSDSTEKFVVCNWKRQLSIAMTYDEATQVAARFVQAGYPNVVLVPLTETRTWLGSWAGTGV